MTKHAIHFAILLLTVTLLGCGAHSISTKNATNVPESRTFAQYWRTPHPGTGALVVKRNTGFVGWATKIRVLVDGVPAADLATSEKVELFVPLGRHVVSARLLTSTIETEVVISPRSTVVLETGYDLAGNFQLRPREA